MKYYSNRLYSPFKLTVAYIVFWVITIIKIVFECECVPALSVVVLPNKTYV